MKSFYIVFTCLSLLISFSSQGQTIEFIENRGQWDGPFKYKAATGKGDVYLQTDGFTYVVGDPSNDDNSDAFEHGTLKKAPVLKFHAYKMSFVNALKPFIEGSKPQSGYYNYFLGNDPRHWESKIHPYRDIDYKQLYKDIDMHISSVGGNMVYDFIVQPRANAGLIQMQYKGQDAIDVKKGNLIISTSVGEIQELKPYAYQYIKDERVVVACNYKLDGNTVSYSFPEDYDHNQTLIIDPTVVFATFTGSTADNWGFTATYDEEGNFYAGGIAHSTGFPVSTGAFQVTYGGGLGNTGNQFASDIAIIKFNSTGTTRLFATYIGGSGNERPHSMIVDSANDLIIAGRSISSNYPVTTTAYDQTYNGGWDIIVTKLSADGSSLIGSTYIGGPGDDGVNFDSTEFGYGKLKHNYGDDARSEVQVDRSGNIYVTGCSRSSGFPTTANAYQTILSGTQDAVIFKLNPTLSSLLWSTYVGGSGEDAGYVLAFDTSQASFYVAGGTGSTDFPSTAGTIHSTYQGDSADGFILKFQNSPPYSLQYGSFIGTSGYDQVYGVQVDNEDNVYVMGQSLGGLFPVTSGVYSNPNSTQFIMKMNNTLSSVIFSTVYGSGDPNHTNISPVAFLVDTCQNIYISGWGGDLFIPTMPSTVGNTFNMPITTNAQQSTTDGKDFYFIVLSKNAATLLYATYMGENGGVGEHVDGGTSRFDKNGIVYQAICGGCGGSSNFPTTAGVWSNTNNSGNCNEIALKIAFQLGPVNALASASPSTHGCAPLFVQFQNTSANALSYQWFFDDGSAMDTASSPSHTFQNPGTYHVRLVANNANACSRVIDTAFLTIVVDTGGITPDFTTQLIDSCGPFIANFTNTSQYSGNPGSQNYTTFQWFFGDNTSYTGTTPPQHTYSTESTYTVTLVMRDTTACNSPDTITHTITFSSLRTTASFTSPDTVCQGTTVSFTNTSLNGQNYQWFFGDGGTQIDQSPVYTYNTPGTYTVTLIAVNPGACNGTDTLQKIITVDPSPTADFTYDPQIPVTNSAVSFTNLSTGAVRYAWDFGDNTGSTDVNPSHLYKRSGNFTVCLQSFNSIGCMAKICKTVPADIQPLADLPKAFSPNGDGSNDVLYVRGAGIQTMDLKIYNRWGEKVFESTDQSIGWNGDYNGEPQPIDAYAYVLDVTFGDGTTLQKKGNVTLLR